MTYSQDEETTNKELADSIYQGFTECEGGSTHPFQDAWNAYVVEHGDIEVGSTADLLVQAAIRYAIDNR